PTSASPTVAPVVSSTKAAPNPPGRRPRSALRNTSAGALAAGPRVRSPDDPSAATPVPPAAGATQRVGSTPASSYPFARRDEVRSLLQSLPPPDVRAQVPAVAR